MEEPEEVRDLDSSRLEGPAACGSDAPTTEEPATRGSNAKGMEEPEARESGVLDTEEPVTRDSDAPGIEDPETRGSGVLDKEEPEARDSDAPGVEDPEVRGADAEGAEEREARDQGVRDTAEPAARHSDAPGMEDPEARGADAEGAEEREARDSGVPATEEPEARDSDAEGMEEAEAPDSGAGGDTASTWAGGGESVPGGEKDPEKKSPGEEGEGELGRGSAGESEVEPDREQGKESGREQERDRRPDTQGGAAEEVERPRESTLAAAPSTQGEEEEAAQPKEAAEAFKRPRGIRPAKAPITKGEEGEAIQPQVKSLPRVRGAGKASIAHPVPVIGSLAIPADAKKPAQQAGAPSGSSSSSSIASTGIPLVTAKAPPAHGPATSSTPAATHSTFIPTYSLGAQAAYQVPLLQHATLGTQAVYRQPLVHQRAQALHTPSSAANAAAAADLQRRLHHLAELHTGPGRPAVHHSYSAAQGPHLQLPQQQPQQSHVTHNVPVNLHNQPLGGAPLQSIAGIPAGHRLAPGPHDLQHSAAPQHSHSVPVAHQPATVPGSAAQPQQQFQSIPVAHQAAAGAPYAAGTPRALHVPGQGPAARPAAAGAVQAAAGRGLDSQAGAATAHPGYSPHRRTYQSAKAKPKPSPPEPWVCRDAALAWAKKGARLPWWPAVVLDCSALTTSAATDAAPSTAAEDNLDGPVAVPTGHQSAPLQEGEVRREGAPSGESAPGPSASKAVEHAEGPKDTAPGVGRSAGQTHGVPPAAACDGPPAQDGGPADEHPGPGGGGEGEPSADVAARPAVGPEGGEEAASVAVGPHGATRKGQGSPAGAVSSGQLVLVAFLGLHEMAWVDGAACLSSFAYMFEARSGKGKKRLHQQQLFEAALTEAKEYESSGKLPWEDPSKDEAVGALGSLAEAALGLAQDKAKGPSSGAQGLLLPPSTLCSLKLLAAPARPGTEEAEAGVKAAARVRKDRRKESAAEKKEAQGGSPSDKKQAAAEDAPGPGKKRRRKVQGSGPKEEEAAGLEKQAGSAEDPETRRLRTLRQLGLLPPEDSPFVWCTVCAP